jgi:hypothetical protein
MGHSGGVQLIGILRLRCRSLRDAAASLWMTGVWECKQKKAGTRIGPG